MTMLSHPKRQDRRIWRHARGEAGVQVRSQIDQRYDEHGVSARIMGGVHVPFSTRLSVAVDGCGWLDIGGVQLREQAEVPVF